MKFGIFLFLFSFFFLPVSFASAEKVENLFRIEAIFRGNLGPFPDAVWRRDDDFLRFVSSVSPLSDTKYRPKKLVSIAGENISQAGRQSQIRADIKPSVLAMARDFSEHFGEPLVAISAFRSAKLQQLLWDLGKCDDGAFCARPWRSEHQLGIAVDFFDAPSEKFYETDPRYKAFYRWMRENAHRYGWTQSYQKGPIIDGYEIEPWHWRYVGEEMATFLKEMNLSYTQLLRWNRVVSPKYFLAF